MLFIKSHIDVLKCTVYNHIFNHFVTDEADNFISVRASALLTFMM